MDDVRSVPYGSSFLTVGGAATAANGRRFAYTVVQLFDSGASSG